jgi:hypothetical protein
MPCHSDGLTTRPRISSERAIKTPRSHISTSPGPIPASHWLIEALGEGIASSARDRAGRQLGPGAPAPGTPRWSATPSRRSGTPGARPELIAADEHPHHRPVTLRPEPHPRRPAARMRPAVPLLKLAGHPTAIGEEQFGGARVIHLSSLCRTARPGRRRRYRPPGTWRLGDPSYVSGPGRSAPHETRQRPRRPRGTDCKAKRP